MERMVALVGSGMMVLGLVWGILIPTLGLIVGGIGAIIALFGLFFDED